MKEPCPWCAGTTTKTRLLGEWAGMQMFAEVCQTEGCGAQGPVRSPQSAAIAAWNRRPPPKDTTP